MDPQPSHSSQQQQSNSNSNTAPASTSGSGSSHARRLSNPLMAFLSSTHSASAPTSPHRSPQPHAHSNQSHAQPQTRQSYQQMLRHLRYPNHDQDPHSHPSSSSDPSNHHMLADSEAGMLMYDDGDQDSYDDLDPDAHGGDDDDDMQSDPELMMVGDEDEDEATGMLGLFGFGGFASGGGAGAASPAKRSVNGGGRPVSGSSNESQPTNTSSSSSSAATAGLGPLRTATAHDGAAAAALPPAVRLAAAALASGGAANSTVSVTGASSSSSTGPLPASTVPVAAGIAVLGGPFPALRDWIVVTASQLPLPTITNLGQVNENTINWLNPIVYLQLLTYPAGAPVVEGGPPAPAGGSQGNLAQRSGSGSKASFSVLRETHLVRQRRRLITLLSTYTVIMRYCSFDAFVVLLVLSTCLMLYFMKNSRKINVQMAKRNIKQRVGWAKQWAGGLFKRNNANAAGDDGEGNFMGSVEGGVGFGHESPAAAAAGVATGASPSVTGEKKRRRGIPGFKKSNSPSNSSNMIAMSAGPNASQAMLAPPASSTAGGTAAAGGSPSVGATATGTSSNGGGSGAAAAAKAAAGARRINNLFRRAASVEPTGDKINPFHADGSANMAAVMGTAVMQQPLQPGSTGQPHLHSSHSGSNNNLGVSTATAALAASSTNSAPGSASVTGPMSAALGVPPTHEPGMYSSGSVEVGGGALHATGGGSGAGAKLSKIFSRRRGNSSAPTSSAASSPASAIATHPGGGTPSPVPPSTDSDSSSTQPPGSVRGLSNDTLTNPIPPALHMSRSTLSSNDSLAIHPNPIIVHTHTSTQPITVLSGPSSSSPVPWSPRTTSAHHPPSVAQLHGTAIMPTSISHDSISGLVSLGANATSGSTESVQSNSSGSSGASKRLGGLQGHARSSSDGQYAVPPPPPGRTLTNASTASSSGSVKSGGRIAAAVVGKAKDLWGHVKGGSTGGSGGTTPTDAHAHAALAAAAAASHGSRSGSLTEMATATALAPVESSPPSQVPQQQPHSPSSHPLPALPPRKPSFAGPSLVASPGSVEDQHGVLRKTPSRSSVGNVAAANAASEKHAAAGGNDAHTPAPAVPQV